MLTINHSTNSLHKVPLKSCLLILFIVANIAFFAYYSHQFRATIEAKMSYSFPNELKQDNSNYVQKDIDRHWNILKNIKSEQVFEYPFPFVVVKNAVPSEIYSNLTKSFPSLDTITGLNNYKYKSAGDNERFTVSSSKLLASKQFVRLIKALKDC